MNSTLARLIAAALWGIVIILLAIAVLIERLG